MSIDTEPDNEAEPRSAADLTQAEYDALVSLQFNGGENVLRRSPNLRSEINKGHLQWDPAVIATNWDWGRQECPQFPGICVRRDRELALFLSGVYPPSLK